MSEGHCCCCCFFYYFTQCFEECLVYQGPVMMDGAVSWIDITNKTTIASLYFSHLLEATEKFHKIATVSMTFNFHWSSPAQPLQQRWHEVTELSHLFSLSSWPSGEVWVKNMIRNIMDILKTMVYRLIRNSHPVFPYWRWFFNGHLANFPALISLL